MYTFTQHLESANKNLSDLQIPAPSLPCVVKVGHAHGGLGKVKVESETNYKVGQEGELKQE